MIQRVLVANRGEIARRIFRTCRHLGIATVAVFSEHDADEPHAREADEPVFLPGKTSAETYLNVDAILEAAKASGADAIHPGYGFLSESAAFASVVNQAGVIWIGPTPDAIEVMGSKLESKRLMDAAGVPIIPSVDLSGRLSARRAAESLGYPILVKASAGGGGKGMRVVLEPADLSEAIESARREAQAAFGDDTVFLEKYLESPRHIEIQVLGDNTGNVVSLSERECSIQRRHQKIIEESPSPALDDEGRRRLGDAAVDAARAVGYTGAGTVEFLYKDGDFYFLEMNARLQVEHPVTEMVTGLDLVEMQLRIADGEPMPASAIDAAISGHAIEARLYAEDPLNDFLPVTGTFHHFELPEIEGLRVDSGIEAGSRVTVHYDPLVAKVIAHAPTREEAAANLSTALRRARLHGPTTNRLLMVRVLEHPEFISGDTDIQFLDRQDLTKLAEPLGGEPAERLAAVAAALADQAERRADATVLTTLPSGWRNSAAGPQRVSYQGHYGRHDVAYSLQTGTVEGIDPFELGVCRSDHVELSAWGQEHVFEVARYGDVRHLDSANGPFRLDELARFPMEESGEEPGSLHAPMPGKLVRVEVSPGDRVEQGQVLVVLEAMKMEHTLRAPRTGTITKVNAATGDQVEADAVLVVVEES